MEPKQTKRLLLLLGTGAAVAALFLWARQPGSNHDESPSDVAQPVEPAATDTATNVVQAQSQAVPPNIPSPFSRIEQPEPPPVWTDGDGRSTNAIRQIAHSDAEVKRMLQENDKIYRRQLVILKDPVVDVVQRARLTGEPLRELTLQGLDGQEIPVEIKYADIDPSGLRGSFYGHVAGRPTSLFSLAFLEDRQAYTIISPEDELYLDVEAHDPGDVVVKSVYLEKYGVGKCGTLEQQ